MLEFGGENDVGKMGETADNLRKKDKVELRVQTFVRTILKQDRLNCSKQFPNLTLYLKGHSPEKVKRQATKQRS